LPANVVISRLVVTEKVVTANLLFIWT